MNKTVKRKLTVIVSVVLVLAMLGGSCVFAEPDDTGDNSEPLRNQLIMTTFIMNGAIEDDYYTFFESGEQFGWMIVPTRPGYVFIGWFDDQNYEDYEYTWATMVPYDDVTLYAHWASPDTLDNLDSGKKLNIYGSNLTSLYNWINVTIWENSGSNEQKWLFSGYGYRKYIKSYVDESYGLNAYRVGSPWNCNMHTVIGNETDAQVDFLIGEEGYYLIKLHNYSYYLTEGGTANGSNVYWGLFDEMYDQLWI